VIISLGDRRHRLLELEEGDVAQHRLKDDRQQMLYSKDGTYISTRSDKLMRIALVPKEQEQQQQASPQQQLSPQQQAAASGGGTSGTSSSLGGKQKKKKTYGQKSAKDDNKKSDTFIEQTKDHNHIRRGNGNVKATDGSTTTYHSDENKQSTKCDGGHTHIRATKDKIWVEDGACLATKPIEIADCGCGGGKKTYGVGGDASTPPAPGASSMSLALSLLTTEQNAQAPSRMRFWIVRHLNSFGVDNCHVDDMDFTALAAGVEVVEWKEGMGEIEYDDRPRLREVITDVTPFAPFFDQFIAKLPNITLVQAKKVKCDLISLLYDNKRQLPYHHAIAAGSFDWDATDAALAAMSIATLPALLGGTTGTGNSLVDQINAQNTSLVNQINANIVAPGDSLNGQVWSLKDQINANIATPGSQAINQLTGIVSEINSGIVDKCNNLSAYIDVTVVGSLSVDANTISRKLQSFDPGGGAALVAAPGLAGGIAQSGISFLHTSGNPYNISGVSVTSIDFVSVTASPLTPGSPGAATIQWTPIGQANPVTVSVTEMADIMSGIHSRRISLLTTKFNKEAAVNALTTIAEIIAYDTTAGWPL
jgi:hypothetical protein